MDSAMAPEKCLSSVETTPQSFSEILEIVGTNGRFQWLTWACIGFTIAFGYMINMSNIFFAYEQDHICTPTINNMSNVTNWTTDMQNYSVSYYVGVEDGNDYSVCRRFNRSMESGVNTTVACTSWVYDESVMASTIVKEWDFVCGRAINIATSQSVYMAGMVVGSLLAATVADFIGRKMCFCISGIILAFSSLLQAFSPTYLVFLALRFLVAFGLVGTWLCGFVLAQEVTSARGRSWIGSCYWLPGALGIWGLSGLAYWLREWRPLQFAISLPQLFFIACFWLIPESPRWLLARGDIGRARKELERAARINGTKLPPDINYDVVSKSIQNGSLKLISADFCLAMKHLGSSNIYIARTLIVWFCWTVGSMVWFGLAWNIGSISGNIFLNLPISGAIDIPSSFAIVLLIKWGRKPGLILCFTISGIACLSKMAKINCLDIVYYFTAKFFSYSAFSIVYIYTAELYPTSIRNTIQGTGSTVAKLGSMLSPYIIIIPSMWPKHSAKAEEMAIVPDMIFGILSLTAAFLSCMLPETKGLPMPELIEDGLKNRSKIEILIFKKYQSLQQDVDDAETAQQTKL